MASNRFVLLLVVCLATLGRCCGQDAAERADSWGKDQDDCSDKAMKMGSGANEQTNNAYAYKCESASNEPKDAYNKAACDSANTASDLAGDVEDKTYKAYTKEGMKERASDAYNKAENKAKSMLKVSMSEQDKQRYEEAKEKVSQAAADLGDKLRGGGDNM